MAAKRTSGKSTVICVVTTGGEMTEAIAICRHCNWGQHRGDKDDVLEKVLQHSETGHPIDVRIYNPDVESPIDPVEDSGRLSYVERTGEFK